MPGPVLLLHGFGASARRTWRDTGWIDLLTEAGRDVIAPDLLGHGDAPKPHDPAAYAELEARVAGELPDGPVDGVGFSLGARVLLTLAVERPERFGRLVLAGVGENLFRHDDPELLAAAVESDEVPEQPWAAYFHTMARTDGNDPLALAAYLRRPHPPALTDEALARVSCPVLVAIGDRDHAGPGQPLVDRLPDARLLVLSGVDHMATPKSMAFLDGGLDFLGAA